MRSRLLLVPLVVCLACHESGRSDAPRAGEPVPVVNEHAAPGRGSSAPAPSDSDLDPDTNEGEPATDELASNEVETEAGLPPWSAFTAATRVDGWQAPAKASTRAWLDDAHAVAVVRTEQGEGHDKQWRISLVRVARETDDAWVVTGVRELERWVAQEDLQREGKIAVNLQVEDLDDDGAMEVATRHRLMWMCGGGGPTLKRTLVISNDDATLSEAAFVDLDEELATAEVHGRETYADRDGDGHRDLVVDWKSVDQEGSAESSQKVFAWAAGDRYRGAQRPVGEQDYCH